MEIRKENYKNLPKIYRTEKEKVFNNLEDMLDLKFPNKTTKKLFKKTVKIFSHIPFDRDLKMIGFDFEDLEDYKKKLHEKFQIEIKKNQGEIFEINQELILYLEKCIYIFIETYIIKPIWSEKDRNAFDSPGLQYGFEVIFRLFVFTNGFKTNIYFLNLWEYYQKEFDYKDIQDILFFYSSSDRFLKIFLENLSNKFFQNYNCIFYNFELEQLKKSYTSLEYEAKKITKVENVSLALNETINFITKNQVERQKFLNLKENYSASIMIEIRTEKSFEDFFLENFSQFYQKELKIIQKNTNSNRKEFQENICFYNIFGDIDERWHSKPYKVGNSIYGKTNCFIFDILAPTIKNFIEIKNDYIDAPIILFENSTFLFLVNSYYKEEQKRLSLNEIEKFFGFKEMLFKKYNIIVDFIKISSPEDELSPEIVKKYGIDVFYYD